MSEVAIVETPVQAEPKKLDNVDIIMKALSSQFSDGFSISQLMIATTAAMKLADKLNEDGPTKRDIVTRALNRLTDQFVSDEAAKSMIKTGIDMYVPNVIDAVVSAAKGNVLSRDGKKRGKLFCC